MKTDRELSGTITNEINELLTSLQLSKPYHVGISYYTKTFTNLHEWKCFEFYEPPSTRRI